MAFQLIDDSEFNEPVTLAEVKSYCRIDSDYTSDDNELEIIMAAARARIEAQINIGLANRDVILQWSGYGIELPLSPTGEIIEVTDRDGVMTSDKYTVDSYQAKSIGINDACCGSGFNYFYNINGTVEITRNSEYISNDLYSVKYNTGYSELTKALKMALLAEIDFLFKQRGEPDDSLISPSALLLCSSYSRNPIL